MHHLPSEAMPDRLCHWYSLHRRSRQQKRDSHNQNNSVIDHDFEAMAGQESAQSMVPQQGPIRHPYAEVLLEHGVFSEQKVHGGGVGDASLGYGN
jgi:hypothetical protein